MSTVEIETAELRSVPKLAAPVIGRKRPVRQLSENDLEQITDLSKRVFGPGGEKSPEFLKQVFFDNRQSYYEVIAGRQAYDYLICIATGRVIEFNSEKLKKLRDEICREHGFDPISHQFHIYGLSAEGKAQNGAAGKVKATISKAPRTSPR